MIKALVATIFLFGILSVNNVIAKRDVQVTSASFESADGGCFQIDSVDVTDDGAVDLTFRVDGCPDNTQVSLDVDLGDNTLPTTTLSLCSILEDEDNLGRDICDHGEPVDEFPDSCPLPSSGTFKIANFKVSEKNVPATEDHTPFTAVSKFHIEDDDDYFATVELKGEIRVTP